MQRMPEERAAGAEVGEDPLQFERLVAAVEDYAIFRLDPQGIILSWNQGAQRIKRYTPEEIVGRHFSCFYMEEDLVSRFPDTELEIAAAEGRFVHEGWRLRKDGTRFWANVTITAIRGPEGGLEGFLKITRDLTDRQQAAEALRQSEERFRLLVESVEDHAIFMLDPEGHVMSWNMGARRIKGYEQSDVIGSHFSRFYPDESRAADLPAILLRQALRDGKVEDEGWRVRKDGSRFWANVSITAVYDGTGELRGFAKITRDLTGRREIDELKDSHRKKDAFLATLAHELRNPLAPLLTGLEMIRRSPADSALVGKLAVTLERQVKQMSHLIDDLLDMSRIRQGKISLKKARVPLAEVLQGAVDAVEPLVAKLGHRLTVRQPEGGAEIEVDPHRLSQVISNLLTNACKFTPSGGSITLDVAVTDGTSLDIRVTDTGKGIPLDWQERIFTLFEQEPGDGRDGLGIGLTLVKDIVELHGGSVKVASEGEGRGSEFRVILPHAVIRNAADAMEPVDTDGAVRVLVADDGRSAADILGLFFRMEGMEPRVVYDGVEAVEAARSFSPAMVLLDLGMPRMDGFEAARQIRRFLPHAAIVALSGWGDEEDRRRTAAAGFDEHLVKPVSPEDLRTVIAKFVKKEG